MKKTASILMSFCFFTGVQAAETGIGVSVQNDEGTIYIPINISERFRLEPTFQMRWEERKVDDEKFTSTRTMLALGFFGQSSMTEEVKVYYGARIGYSYIHWEDQGSFSTNRQEIHGVNIDPTLGVEYFFSERFSVGGEVSWFVVYQDSTSGPDRQSTRTGTDSKLIARFYF